MRTIKETPAGIADEYTERIKARRRYEVPQENRPIKHITTVMIEMIHELQNLKEEDFKKAGSKQ